MEQYIFDDGNGLWYERCGDYYVPCLTLPEEKPVGIWGRRYRRWLKEHRRVTYNEMLMSGILSDHVAEVDRQAEEMLDRVDTADGGAGRHHRTVQSRRSNGMGRCNE